MGCHIYIQNRITDEEIECPWYRVYSTDSEKQFHTRNEFEQYLRLCQERDSYMTNELVQEFLSIYNEEKHYVELL